ncbi:hypothetical protein SeMB42_g04256 [Synchytrium endobioticum]|uniref:Signal recognition particle subunit SRP68 n=1 Tax=Synchytrium endobioticum TaxID=286115 RepID=A0A507CZM8_9FUNG|nr:hypothetical protein SeMB42_g04256 [Synchytrium endobioticum]
MEADASKTEPRAPLSIDVLAVTRNAQDTHGLRHQDYLRYRHYCARKIHRVRRVVGNIQGKKKYEKRDIPAETATLGHLEILLFQAERAWAYAMQLKGELAQEPRRKHRARARLRKDARTMLDVQAYATLMKGYVLFEEQRWQEALDKFAAARTIYEKLATVGTAGQEALGQAAVDAIDPSIRFCAYNLKIKGGASADVAALIEIRNKSAGGAAGLDLLTQRIEETLAQTRHEKAASVSSIVWRGKTVPSKNQQLIESILAAQESLQQLDDAIKADPMPVKNAEALEERLKSFDAVIGALWDSSRIAEQDVKDDAVAVAKVKTSKSDANTFNLQYASSYVAYLRLSKTVERNILLIEATKHKVASHSSGHSSKMPDQLKSARPEDVPKLFNAIINTLKETAALPGIETDMALQRLLSAKISLYHAYKVYHIGLLLYSSRRRAEAFAMMDKASEYLVSARAEIDSAKKSTKKSIDLSPEDSEGLSALMAEISSLDSSVRGVKIRERASAVMELSSSSTTDTLTGDDEGRVKRPPLINSLDTFLPSFNPVDPKLVDFPPTFQAIPCKPLFFDVAYNSVEYPITNIARRAKGLPRLTPGEKDIEKPAKGVFGVLSNLWGGSSK